VLLNRVIRQVDKPIRKLVMIELFARGSDVAIFICESFQEAADWRKQPEATKVELSSMDKQRVVYVFLDDKRPFAFGRSANDGFDLAKSTQYFYSVAAVCVLARFYYPWVFGNPVLTLVLFDLRIFWLSLIFIIHYSLFCLWPEGLPQRLNFGILVLLARLDPVLKLLKVLAKASELRVFKPSLRVESQWQNLEGVFADGLIISPHIDKDTLFVG
jgi:hypothetical protein